MLSGLSLYEMGLFYCRWRGGKTYIQKLVAMAEENGMSFASFLMDAGREHMLRMVQELSYGCGEGAYAEDGSGTASDSICTHVCLL